MQFNARSLCALIPLVVLAFVNEGKAQTFAVLGEDNVLAVFDREVPEAPLYRETISGLLPGETLLGIDVRPLTGELYGLGSSGRLYVVNTATAVVTPVGSGFATPLAGTRFGFDFNPTVDRIRIVSNTGQNLRAHPVTGAIAFVDGSLTFALTDPNSGASPAVAGAAYTNSFAGATTTTLYDIDTNLDILVTQVPPNTGVLNTIGSLGMNVASVLGFDISGETGEALVAMRLEGSSLPASVLATIDLATGSLSPISVIGLSGEIQGLAILRHTGVLRFGNSTPGCNGRIGIGTNSKPALGNQDFALCASNSVPNMPVLAVLSLARLQTPVLMGNLEIWLDFAAGTIFLVTASDANGMILAPFPIPMAAGLAGQVFHAQIGVGDPCINGNIAATKGLTITIQP